MEQGSAKPQVCAEYRNLEKYKSNLMFLIRQSTRRRVPSPSQNSLDDNNNNKFLSELLVKAKNLSWTLIKVAPTSAPALHRCEKAASTVRRNGSFGRWGRVSGTDRGKEVRYII